DERGRARREPERDRPLVDRRAGRALDRLGVGRRPDRIDRHTRGHPWPRAAIGARRDRDEGSTRGGDLSPARAGEARRHALLLRRADPARDRRGARSDGIARLPAAYEGDPAPQVAARRVARARATRALTATPPIRLT